MKKRFLIFVIFILFFVSLITFILVLNYVDVYENTFLALFSLLFSYTLFISSFGCLILYFFKKIYFRGDTHIYNVLASFRQGFLISVFGSCMVYFIHIGLPLIIGGFLMFICLLSLEFFIKNREN